MNDDFGRRAREARIALGISQEQVAALAGTSQSTVERIENGGALRSRFRNEVAEVLKIPVKYVVDDTIPEAPGMARVKPLPEFLGPRDLQVFAAVEGGPGEMVISTDPIDLVPRPWFFQHVKEAYAVVVTGESMQPVYDPGDMVLVNPRLPPLKGKDAIFVAGESHGEFRASIKRYMGITESHWLARQFNPPEGQKADMKLDRREWERALRVVGRYTG